MERLSSCYFCGTAVDAPLEDYPVGRGSTGEGLVVTLCPTCRRKLTTIVERVVAEDGPAATATAADGTDTDRHDEDDTDRHDEDDTGRHDEDDAEILDDASPADEPIEGDRPAAPDGLSDASESDASLDGSAVSVLEYNRVMRLLENRELPVERVAFRELATSAYELAPGTVDAVLDAAIDGGLLAEDDEGSLVRAPGRDSDVEGSGDDPAG